MPAGSRRGGWAERVFDKLGDVISSLDTVNNNLQTVNTSVGGIGAFDSLTGGISSLWTDVTNLAGGASAESSFIDLSNYRELAIGRSITTVSGVYLFEIDWSRSGSSADFTEQIISSVLADKTTITKRVAFVFAKFRVRNTGATGFTSHITHVGARS